MSRISFHIGLTALQDTTFEGKVYTAIDAEIGRSLKGGNNNLVWAGNNIPNWADGVHDHTTSDGGLYNAVGIDAIWIRHSGFDYDVTKPKDIDWSSPNDATLFITAGGAIIASLKATESIFLPKPDTMFTYSDNGDPIAVEYAVFT